MRLFTILSPAINWGRPSKVPGQWSTLGHWMKRRVCRQIHSPDGIREIDNHHSFPSRLDLAKLSTRPPLHISSIKRPWLDVLLDLGAEPAAALGDSQLVAECWPNTQTPLVPGRAMSHGVMNLAARHRVAAFGDSKTAGKRDTRRIIMQPPDCCWRQERDGQPMRPRWAIPGWSNCLLSTPERVCCPGQVPIRHTPLVTLWLHDCRQVLLD